MEDIEKVKNIVKKYQREFDDIEGILTNLRNKNIYGIEGNKSQGDGALHTNINELRKKIYELVRMVALERESETDTLVDMFVDKK